MSSNNLALYADGYNPLRWDCDKRGCFNRLRRPKIEVFSECFPGKINFGDIDGIVELNGKALLLEWKSEFKEIPTGQKIMYERITKSGDLSVIVLIGNAETMNITHSCIFYLGKKIPAIGYSECSLEDAKNRIKNWRIKIANRK